MNAIEKLKRNYRYRPPNLTTYQRNFSNVAHIWWQQISYGYHRNRNNSRSWIIHLYRYDIRTDTTKENTLSNSSSTEELFKDLFSNHCSFWCVKVLIQVKVETNVNAHGIQSPCLIYHKSWIEKESIYHRLSPLTVDDIPTEDVVQFCYLYGIIERDDGPDADL